MSSVSPASVLYSSDGYELASINGSLIPTNTRGLLIEGSDGSGNSRFMSVDASGRPVVVGAGTAGSAVGGVVTIQGVSSMTPVQVSQATASNLNATVVGTGSAGTAATGVITIQGIASMTPVQVSQATAANLNATVVQGTSPWITNISQFGGSNVVTGTGASGAGIPRVTVSNDSNILATQSGTWTVQPGNTANTTPWLVINDGYVTTSAPTYSNNTSNYLSLDTSGNLRTLVAGTSAAGSPSSTQVITVQGNASGTPLPISGSLTVDKSSTSSLTSVAATTSSTTLVAANPNRISTLIYNESSNKLYIGLTSSAISTTSYTIQLMPNSYWELPISYTGQINGIWNGTNGSARITDLSV